MNHLPIALALSLAAATVAAADPYPGAPGIEQGARTETMEFGGTTTTTGEVDGKRLRADTTTFGGTTTTTGEIDGKRFTCESFEFGGIATRNCR